MQRYMIYLKNQSYSPKDATRLLSKARGLVSDSKIIVRDTRVSKHYIEFDTSLPDNKNVENVIDKLTLITPLSEYQHIVEKHINKEEGIKNARSLFNDEKYWSAHEILEYLWKNSHSDEKDLLNGIILIAAAFVHDEKDESDICISILKRSMKKLSKATGLYFGIDIDKIKELVSQITETSKIQRFTI
jgi:uncharacterized protein